MRKLLICIIAIIVISLAVMYRPVKGQNKMSLNYATMSSISYSYTKDRTGQKLLDLVKENTEWNKVSDNENANKVQQGAVNTNIPDGSNATVEAAIKFCEDRLGLAYVFGGTTDAGYDCSGLMQAAYRAAGKDISRLTYTQIYDGIPIDAKDQSQWKRGDLIFPHAGHVVMYLGNGQVIHSPQTGDVIKISPIYWLNRHPTYVVRRIVE